MKSQTPIALVFAAALAAVASCKTQQQSALLTTQEPKAATSGAVGDATPLPDPTVSETQDLKDKILTKRSADCKDYTGSYAANVKDVRHKRAFIERVAITSTATHCQLRSNTIPNHDFNDESARFVNQVEEVEQNLQIARTPRLAVKKTPLNQRAYDAVMLNGVVLDILSAGCYRPDDPMANKNGNVAIGCSSEEPWLLDPLGPRGTFATDIHNAHAQPDGLYHYHGNPMALFDEAPGALGSPVVGFAADGFPIYGSFFKDDQGTLRKARSGYTLKAGSRPSGGDSPGGKYDGMYNADYAFTGSGDLDECNGMTIEGQYGYYVTDTFPWVIRVPPVSVRGPGNLETLASQSVADSSGSFASAAA